MLLLAAQPLRGVDRWVAGVFQAVALGDIFGGFTTVGLNNFMIGSLTFNSLFLHFLDNNSFVLKYLSC